jgi:1-deoxy-D-xylulose-5-phosphate reductoisomerase
MMKNLYLLGATGSIGRQVCEIVDQDPSAFRILTLTANGNIEGISALIEKYHPEFVAMGSEEAARVIGMRHPGLPVGFGEAGLVKAATWSPEDHSGLLVNALVGSCGLVPTYRALEMGRSIALANKETLVIGGTLILDLAKKNQARIFPIDSEHSAIWQCLQGNDPKTVRRLIITASGGAFRNKTRSELMNVTLADALRHPNWAMGAKITIDSATMMNKGFEVIEAHHLFGIPVERIETVLHPESYVHSLVEFVDGSMMAQISDHDMRLPISYALNGGTRVVNPTKSLDLAAIGRLSFEPMDFQRFPCLGMAYEAIREGGIRPCVMNAANEAAVRLFIDRKIPFLEIENIIREQMDRVPKNPTPTLADLIAVDRDVKDNVSRLYLK